MRALTLVALMLLPTLAGCLGGEEKPRLAQPTSSPIVLPPLTTPRAPTQTYNFSDPGYRMTAAWRPGDGWDYESNESHYRHVRVIDSRLLNGRTWYIVEEKTGKTGMPAERTSRIWIDGRDWLQVNASDDTGGRDNYTPGRAMRYLKNGSFAYEHTRMEGSGRQSVNESVNISTRLQPVHETLRFPWGYVEAKRIDMTLSTRAAGQRTETTSVRWVHVDYLNDVQYRLPGGETFTLVAAKAGNFRRGTLA